MTRQLSDDLQQQIAVCRQIAELISCAADLSRAVALEDGATVRARCSAIQGHRNEILAMIYDWKPELLRPSGEVGAVA